MTVTETIASVVGRTVRFRGETATVSNYDPLGSGMTDTLLQFPNGRELWVASHECRTLPSRRAVREQADAERDASLRAIREQHIQDWREPWPGCEFGKAHFGQMLNRALGEE